MLVAHEHDEQRHVAAVIWIYVECIRLVCPARQNEALIVSKQAISPFRRALHDACSEQYESSTIITSQCLRELEGMGTRRALVTKGGLFLHVKNRTVGTNLKTRIRSVVRCPACLKIFDANNKSTPSQNFRLLLKPERI